jgi:hypothetical protein
MNSPVDCKAAHVFALLHRLSRGGEWTRLRRDVKKLNVTSHQSCDIKYLRKNGNRSVDREGSTSKFVCVRRR